MLSPYNSSICCLDIWLMRASRQTSCYNNLTVFIIPISPSQLSLFSIAQGKTALDFGLFFLLTFGLLVGFMHQSYDYNRMSRVRQFGDLRNSRTSRNGSLGHFATTSKFEKASSTHSHYVCVNCVNKSMSQQKANLRASQRKQENNFLKTLQWSRLEQDHKLAEIRAARVQQEKRKVMQHNKTAMKEWQERKAMEKHQKLQDKKLEQLNLNQYQKKIEEEKRREALLKQNWRKDIDRQLQIKQDRINKQKEEEKKPIPITKENQREDKIIKIQQERLEKYRNDLLNQIKEQHTRKEKEKNQKSNDHENRSFILLERAEERTRKMEQLERERKRKIVEQKHIYDAKLQKKRVEQRQIIQRQKAFERAVKEREQQKARQMQKRRESQIHNYLSQIKQQMEDKQKRRKNQQIFQKTTLNEMFIKERTIESRLCDSCEKPYPKPYLTKVIDQCQ